MLDVEDIDEREAKRPYQKHRQSSKSLSTGRRKSVNNTYIS